MSGETYNPAVSRTKEVYPDVPRRRWNELVRSLLFGFVSLSCLFSDEEKRAQQRAVQSKRREWKKAQAENVITMPKRTAVQ